jgi:glucan 1,3-beta-glucosidase
MNFAVRPQGLLDGDKYYAKSKPTYANLNKDDFISVRGEGAKGDGQNDDTKAIQDAIKAAGDRNKILYFEHGMFCMKQP